MFGYDLLSQSSLTDIGDETQTNTAFYHYDSLGTTRNLSNTDASISDSYFYEAFGELLASEGETDNDYLYTGEQYDAQLDNYYLRARYYSQGVGRFTQMDTWMGSAGSPMTLNKYAYGNADPINFSDSTGNFSITELQVVNNIRSNLSSLQIDLGISLLDGYFNPDSASSNAGDGAILLGLSAIGGPASFKILRMLSGKFRKACNSFTGDTLVSTEFGLKAIKDIKIGDKVWAYNDQTGEKSLQPVIHLISSEGEKEIVDITLLSGDVIQATGNHPFYVNTQVNWDWLDANAISADMDLFDINKQNVDATRISSHIEELSVFNLTVANDHTYFVSDAEVLTHNANKKCRVGGIVPNAPKPTLEINYKRVPGKPRYNRTAGTLPSDWKVAFDRNAVFDGKKWWAKGKGGALYRYETNGNGVFHWNGSTKDALVPLTRKAKIPNEVLKLFNLPSKGPLK
ncbi:hypothetical protein ISG33_11100 [Glaciecola sp. MH2013]|uniref:RHS repeat-associated core domain-containing protein n=1 Tax=Glaciecola sp. MH2013 TaxID=2785524 RepID=UPI00189DBBC7|nr:RHS repeat-associated core domain-containing protein [Glaciecola sp. MH2013]MBF7073946.1 hypothetical protein [Glaciecola sp. MH2013]